MTEPTAWRECTTCTEYLPDEAFTARRQSCKRCRALAARESRATAPKPKRPVGPDAVGLFMETHTVPHEGGGIRRVEAHARYLQATGANLSPRAFGWELRLAGYTSAHRRLNGRPSWVICDRAWATSPQGTGQLP